MTLMKKSKLSTADRFEAITAALSDAPLASSRALAESLAAQHGCSMRTWQTELADYWESAPAGVGAAGRAESRARQVAAVEKGIALCFKSAKTTGLGALVRLWAELSGTLLDDTGIENIKRNKYDEIAGLWSDEAAAEIEAAANNGQAES